MSSTSGVYNLIQILRVHDPDGFARYVEGHVETLAPFGGRIVARGTPIRVEGEALPPRTVIQYFPSRSAFEQWYHSDAYRPWKQLRQSVAEVEAMLVAAC